MGAVAADLCDLVIITEDENYHEDGMEIMQQVVKGIEMMRDGKDIAIQSTDLPSREYSLPTELISYKGMSQISVC
jgi:molybdopterin biosynthesis enzyme